MARFKRNIRAIEEEIVYQILFAELAFDICKMIPIIPGKGHDIAPYFYNLNFSRGVIALHSLLISRDPDEISFRNYSDQYKWEYKNEVDETLKVKISEISIKFSKIHEPSLRHKIAAHISQQFKHTDFTSAYIIPDLRVPLSEVLAELKDFFLALPTTVKQTIHSLK